MGLSFSADDDDQKMGDDPRGAPEDAERSPRKRARPDFDEDGAASLAKLEALADEIARVDMSQEKAATELLTQLLCKIDAVDTFGDPRLRAYRKKLIRRVEALDPS